ncbi:PTS sugar transporter subunit IIA [Clostridium sp. K04]|uniref:PTS sugar transporter subunit IIA n=1 Tax=Clostridium sp. K04 TaxID=2718929 RepID=UPI001C8CCC64|nr:PTS sugar transporter subunit IIA [Clostridium sp. K04]MBX9184551.1 PTS sugar transporter subunit IIA [Clostridium sp. K04]
MIEKILNEDFVEIGVEVDNWIEAVKVAGGVLLKNNKIEEQYIDAMIKTVEEMGAYIVMAPGIAMPHGRPEAGVKDIGISVILLKNPVKFGNEEFDPVKLVFAICAKEHDSHIELLKDLSLILDDNEIVDRVTSCKSKKEFIELLIKCYENNK